MNVSDGELSPPTGYSGFPFAIRNAMPLMMVIGCYDRVSIPVGYRFGKRDRALTVALPPRTSPFNL